MILFGAEAVVCECRNQNSVSKIRGLWPSPRPSNDRPNFEVILTSARLRFDGPRRGHIHEIHSDRPWNHLITSYTSRELTFSVDRILAISGIAHQVGTAIQDRYCAGLWLSDMCQQLSWSITEDPQPIPDHYQGPSWSWVSVNGIVFYHYDKNFRPAAEIVGVDIKLKDARAPYGSVLYGLLQLHSRTLPAELVLHENGEQHVVMSGTHCKILHCSYYPDTRNPSNGVMRNRYSPILLAQLGFGWTNDVACIVLRIVREWIYSRVRLLNVDQSKQSLEWGTLVSLTIE